MHSWPNGVGLLKNININFLERVTFKRNHHNVPLNVGMIHRKIFQNYILHVGNLHIYGPVEVASTIEKKEPNQT